MVSSLVLDQNSTRVSFLVADADSSSIFLVSQFHVVGPSLNFKFGDADREEHEQFTSPGTL